MERKCKGCGFFKPDIFKDCVGWCAISGNRHCVEDICEAEEREYNERKAD